MIINRVEFNLMKIGTVPRAVVVGLGVGGLTCALSLVRSGRWEVTVLEKGARGSRYGLQPQSSKNSNTVGLWGPSLRCLAALGVLPQLKEQLAFVRHSGYRAVDGRMLATPNLRLDDFDFDFPSTSAHQLHPRPTLAFMNEYDLRQILLEELRASNILVRPGLESLLFSKHAKCATVTDSAGSIFEADVVIAADGSTSTVRQLVYPDSEHHSSLLKPRGYTVFRGRSPTSLTHGRLSEDAFQTWGEHARFACVPTHDGNAWFAAISNQHLPHLGSIRMCEESVDERHHHRHDCDFTHHLCQYRVPSTQLTDFFTSWHNPIAQLLSTTCDHFLDDDCFIGTEAMAFDHVHQQGFSKTMPNGNVVAFIGDASHTLDPILAQGAGVAIEDAVTLATLLTATTKQHHVRSNIDVAGDADVAVVDADGDDADVATTTTTTRSFVAALADFETRKIERVSRLHILSNLAQGVGHLDSRVLCWIRDVAMLSVPTVLKSACFDRVVHASLSGKSVFRSTIAPNDPAMEFVLQQREINQSQQQ